MSLVSIIIPAYNAESSLERCLLAIQQQSYSQWEAWVIDDGSTDATRALTSNFCTQDPRIHLVESPQNQGVSAARNLGIDRATGDYLAFCDADDEWHPEKLQQQLEMMREEGANLCCSSFWFYNTQTARRHQVNTLANIDLKTLRATNPIPLSTAMVHRSLVENHQFPTLPKPYIHEDYAFWWNLFASHSVKVVNLQEPLVTLYVNPTSRSSNKWLAARSHFFVLKTVGQMRGFALLMSMFTYAYYALKKRLSLN